MSINIQERVLDTLFDIAVKEKGVCGGRVTESDLIRSAFARNAR